MLVAVFSVAAFADETVVAKIGDQPYAIVTEFIVETQLEAVNFLAEWAE